MKKLIALLLALLTVFFLTACDDESATPAQKSNAAVSSSADGDAVNSDILGESEGSDTGSVEKGKNCLFKQGLLAAYEGGKWGYINQKGEWVIEPQFDGTYAYNFGSIGIAMVKLDGLNYGFINTDGKVIAQSDNPSGFSDAGLAPKKAENGLCGYINTKGEWAIDPVYDEVGPFATNGLASVQEDGGDCGHINTKGEWVTEPIYDMAYNFRDNGLACVRLNRKYGVVNENGEIIIPVIYESLINCDSFNNDGLASVEVDGKYGFINIKGEMVIEPTYEYVNFGGFTKVGLAAAEMDGKWGFIDKTGNFVISPMYEDVESFNSNGLARVEINGKIGAINAKGEMVVQPVYDAIGDFGDSSQALLELELEKDFGPKDLIPVKIAGKWGYINAKGESVIAPVYSYCSIFFDDGYAVAFSGSGFGVINTSGEQIFQQKYFNISTSV